MSNYIYCIASAAKTLDLVCDPMVSLPIMLRSAVKHCDCKVLIASYFPKGPPLELYDIKGLDMEFIALHEGEIEQLMQTKIARLAQYPFKDGDRVFVMDTDTIIQADIFDVFDKKEFDVGMTTRYYDYPLKINAGVWCFRHNDKVREYLKFFSDQMFDSTWKPFDKMRRTKSRFSDQDFMCAVHEHGPPVECNIADIGPMYNYCPASDKLGMKLATEDMQKAIGNSTYKVLHFKGELMKSMQVEVGQREECL